MTTRIPKWQAALEAVFKERDAMPFKWGANDCCMFAADCVRAITGTDPAADLRGTYSGESSAAKVLADLGGVEGIAAARAGKECPVLSAQIGDVVLAVVEGRDTLTIYGGGGLLFAPGPHGIVHLSRSLGKRAWRCTAD